LKLIIDIGNTKVKLALFLNKELIRQEAIAKFSKEEINNFCSNESYVSSIVSSVRDLSKYEKELLSDIGAIILNKDTPIPISSNYLSMQTLGSDRIAGVVGATMRFPKKNIWVFDAGTCLTMDFIDEHKIYHGGRISPGINMRFTALNKFTDKLPLVQIEDRAKFIGNDTNSSIFSGVQNGIVDEVNTLLSEYTKQNNDFVVIFTGGDCFFFEKALKISIFADPFLVLRGLNEILDFNE